MMWLTSVVFPEDSGPKISTIRPRGTPPMPERQVERQGAGRDRLDLDRALVAEPHQGALAEVALDLGDGGLQRRVLGLGLLRRGVLQVRFLVCHLDHLTAAPLRAARLGPTGRSAHPSAGVQNGRASSGRQGTGSKSPARQARRAASRPAAAAAIRAPPAAPWRPSHAARKAASRARRSRAATRLSLQARLQRSRRPGKAPAGRRAAPCPAAAAAPGRPARPAAPARRTPPRPRRSRSISFSGRWPRKASVMCSDSGATRRSAGSRQRLLAPGRRFPPAPPPAGRARRTGAPAGSSVAPWPPRHATGPDAREQRSKKSESRATSTSAFVARRAASAAGASRPGPSVRGCRRARRESPDRGRCAVPSARRALKQT